MRKKILILAGIVIAFSLAGCGGKSKTQPAPTPAPQPSEVPEPVPTQTDLVDMQVTAKKSAEPAQEEMKYEIGPKDESSDVVTSVIVENQTGSQMAEFFLRVHPNDDYDEEDEWGDEMIGSSFTLASGEKMRCYFYKNGSSTNYDIRIGYSDENLSECFFRSIPLENITKIALRMEGSGEDSIPYATYDIQGQNREYSTLNDVKRRLGLLDNDLDSVSDGDDVMQSDVSQEPVQDENTAEEAVRQENEAETEAAQDPGAENTNSPIVVDTGEIVGDSEAVTGNMATAREYIGQPLGTLQAVVGSPNASDYEDEPQLGMTGYHYYGSFTVSTAVDTDGSEIVTGVW